NIVNARVVEMIRSAVAPDGTVGRATGTWGIVTQGTNLAGIMLNKYADRNKVLTDSIQETARVLGIEAARQKIMSEMRSIIDACDHRHYMLYADDMTFTGEVTPVGPNGPKTREPN